MDTGQTALRRRACVPRRSVTHSHLEALTRFGRRWLWEMTLNVPLIALESLDHSNIDLSIRQAAAAMLDLPISKLTVDLLDLKSFPSGPQVVNQIDPSINSLGSAASDIGDGRATQCLQMVLWSQWTKQHATQHKLPSWVEEPPPRSKPRPARHYLLTASRPSILALFDTQSASENLRTPDPQTSSSPGAVIAR